MECTGTAESFGNSSTNTADRPTVTENNRVTEKNRVIENNRVTENNRVIANSSTASNTSLVELIVIEDEKIEAEAIFRGLSECGVDVQAHYAVDGGVALGHLLRLAKQQRCDNAILVLDLGMPLIDGLELLNQIRSSPDLEQATVFVQTGSADPKMKQVAEEIGVDGYFSKDELPALLAAVKARINEKIA